MALKRIIKEPLLHFFVIGAALFLMYSALNQGEAAAPDEIVVDASQIENLRTQFARVWQRPPTEDELQGLIDDWVRQEILYREGVAQGLDRDDPIVRRRVAQKMEFIADGLAPSVPTDAELQQWLDAHAETYRLPDLYSFRQIYFDPARRGETLSADVANARTALRADDAPVTGDPTLLPETLAKTSKAGIERVFGSDFAAALVELPLNEWAGPVESAFGVHLVQVEDHVPGRDPAVQEVRAALERDLLHARSQEISNAFYEALRARYEVRVEPSPKLAADASGR